MAKFSIKMTAQDERKFNSDLQKFAKAFKFTSDQALDAQVLEMELEAKKLVPVDKGFLRSSINWSVPRPNARRLFTSSGYGLYVEFGTRRQNAQPFLRPAYERTRRRMAIAYRKQFAKQK